jgi:hypothetical protein
MVETNRLIGAEERVAKATIAAALIHAGLVKLQYTDPALGDFARPWTDFPELETLHRLTRRIYEAAVAVR